MKNKWYPVPPYRNEGWTIVNEKGEHVATFEDRSECELVCDLFNEKFSYETQKQDDSFQKTEEKEYIKGIANLAARLGISPPTVQKWKNRGKIPYTQHGRFIHFELNEVLEALNEKKSFDKKSE